MSAGKRTADAAYDRTGYANVADKFVICVQREGSFSITTEDCRNLLALISERDALREALRNCINHAGPCAGSTTTLLRGCIGYLNSLPESQKPDPAWFAPLWDWLRDNRNATS